MLSAFCRPASKKLLVANLSEFLKPKTDISQLHILLSKDIKSVQKVQGILNGNESPTVINESKNYVSTSESKEFAIPTRAYKIHNLQDAPGTSINISAVQVRKMLTQMTIIRRLEATCGALYMSKIIRGFCHLYVGQEAVAVGICSQLTPEDAVITSYRCHAWAYLCGITTYQILAELSAKETGNVRGKGGSMHMFSNTFYGGNGIVGAQVPLGTGIALSMMYKKKNSVMVVLYGDGAANQGQVFEAFNIAKLWNLPVVYVCENNQYGMGTSAKRSSASINYYTRGDYIPGIHVDGMDIVTVCEAARFAINYVKTGNGPILMEMNTYRFLGHSMSDPGTSYRKKVEVTDKRNTSDPISLFKNVIAKYEILTDDEVKRITKEAKIQIDEDAKRAAIDPAIKVEELTYDIYKNAVEPDVRGLLPWTRLQHKNIGKRNEGKGS